MIIVLNDNEFYIREALLFMGWGAPIYGNHYNSRESHIIFASFLQSLKFFAPLICEIQFLAPFARKCIACLTILVHVAPKIAALCLRHDLLGKNTDEMKILA